MLRALGSTANRQVTMQTLELRRRLMRRRVDVVLANYGRTGVSLLPLCRELSIPLVVHFHGYDAHMESEIARWGEGYRQLGRECAQVIAVSERMQAALVGLGIPADKITLVRYGVDPERFEPRATAPDAPLFFGIGRFVDKKAPYLTLLAFDRVRRSHPEARLALAGDGPLFETMHNLVGALGLGGAVEFPGVLSPDEVARWMRRATSFVQHSVTPRVGPSAGDSEGTPVAMLEAMMTGLPVIATRHAGMGEVIEHGVNGLLVDERDVEGMAGAMARVIESRAEAARMGEEGRRHALERHTSSRYLQQLGDVLESAAAGVNVRR
ncbi:MAG TPA: glycosyltransferase [Luteolibacter sp.]|nr:glycosyltransferase [Luteolibacter sp.]